jgi:K+-sensing histidine kinase KdpD
VADESRRLVNVVDNLIVEARVRVSGLAATVEAIHLDEEIRSIWNQFHHDDGWELRIEGSGSVQADRVRLRQLLTNLVDNALTVGESPLRVAILEKSNVLIGHFENGGAAFLEPFSEFSPEQVPTAKGHTGLGLRAARTLAQSMSGDLQYRDGAFVLSLPTSR